MSIGGRAWGVGRATWHILERSFDEGSVQAGNLAYLSLTTLFSVTVIVATIAGSLGRGPDGLRALNDFLASVPPQVGKLLGKPIADLVERRSHSGILGFGIVVGLWSAASYIETIREIIRNAYGTIEGEAFWRRRLASIGAVIASVLLILIAFALQFVLTGASSFVKRVLPLASEAANLIDIGRVIQALVLYGALYILFALLTPNKYRRCCPEWPGALLTSVVWIGATALLPTIIAQVANYELTYGSLAGVMISLLFFYVVGVGLVMGANLNAMLAGAEPTRDKEQRGVAPAKDT
jgi:membrane protein